MGVRAEIDPITLTDKEMQSVIRYQMNLQELAAQAIRAEIQSREDSDDMVRSLLPATQNALLRKEIERLKAELEQVRSLEELFEPVRPRIVQRR